MEDAVSTEQGLAELGFLADRVAWRSRIREQGRGANHPRGRWQCDRDTHSTDVES